MKRLVFAVAGAALLSGCGFNPQLRGVAVDHNVLVANTANSLTLLNILRSRDRLPTHYTGITSLNGSASLEASAGTEATIAEGGGEEFVPSLGVTVNGGSSFDVAVYDDREFYQGITGSIPNSTIIHFLDQGWPDDLLTALLTSSVDIVATQDAGAIRKGQVVATIENDPDEEGSGPFEQLLRCYRLGAVTTRTEGSWLMPVDPKRVSERVYGDLYEGKVVLREQKAGRKSSWWLYREGGEERELAVVPRDTGCDDDVRVTSLVRSGPSRVDEYAVSLANAGEREFVAKVSRSDGAAPPLAVKAGLSVRLRSAESMIYYLGEYLRKGDRARPRLTQKAGGETISGPIVAVSRDKPAHAFAAARHDGAMHYVGMVRPGNVEDFRRFGRSSQTFTLVQQLINLQKATSDRPSTATVRVLP